jgi:hypothetical protein
MRSTYVPEYPGVIIPNRACCYKPKPAEVLERSLELGIPWTIELVQQFG